MSVDRWQRLKEAFHAAVDRPLEARGAFLDEICADDLAFRRELEALLSSHDEAGSFLVSPALADRPATGAAVSPTLAAGTRLGPYEIESRVGRGGMGEVYRARDTRLERVVAIKVLPVHLAQHPDARRRFEREAKAISALNHPHICVLYDMGHQDGVDYLVMEYLEGENLVDRLERGALPLEQVLGYGFQIAEALDRAHRQGIVHRDLKPANVMLTKSGAKLLDFGLAKLRSTTEHPLASERAAGHKPLTEQGTIMGTFPYMAPEQLEGREPDARTDIFAFGATLHEMATGQRAFTGDSQAALIAAILSSQPPSISRFQPLAPPALDRVVTTCLAKDPDDRWQSAHDLARELRWIAEAGSKAGVPAPVVARRRSRERLAWTISGVACALLGMALLFPLPYLPERPEPFQVHLQISPPEKTVFPWWNLPAVSPDGEHIVFSASADNVSHLYLRSLSSLRVRQVPGSEGAYWAFWSPDRRQIGFYGTEGKLMKVDPSDGSRQTLYTLPTGGGLSAYGGASWSPGGIIIFSMHGELLRMMASGGEAEPLGKRAEGETGRYWPQFLPDGRHYLYFSRAARPENGGIYVASLDSSDRKRISASDSNAAYSPSGHLLFPRGGALMAQAFDVERLELSGEAFHVAERLALFAAVLTGAAYSVSSNGVLAWRTGSAMARRQLTWFDRSGKTLATLGEPADYSNPALSPDERSLAVCRTNSGLRTRDLWIFDLVRGSRSKLTSDPADEFNPAWSPDGARIAFTSDRRGVREIYQTLANGSGEDELLLESTDWAKQVEDWSPDGKLLLYDYYQGGGPSDLFLLPLSPDGERKPVPFVATPAVEDKGQFAPNGRWLAYGSDESGVREIYVRGVSTEAGADRGRWKVSEGGGDEPRWRRDGRELFFVSGFTLMAVDVRTDGASFEAGVPKPLFEARLPLEVRRNRFVVTRDGQRFLVNTALEETIEPIQVLVNWPRSKR